MVFELTLSIIKPDAVFKDVSGAINKMIQDAGLQIVAQRMMFLTPEVAGRFYEVHRERPFFEDLVAYMSSGPVVVQVLAGENAIERYRDLMGATNPKDAAKGTIREAFGASIEANAVHGSDSIESAKTEIPFFFARYEIFSE